IGESLLYVLRERLRPPRPQNAPQPGGGGSRSVLLGGGGGGACRWVVSAGACSVLLDGVLVASCCVLAADAAGSDVRTVEGLSPKDELTDVQRAFVEQGAVQCGFCIPGMIVAIHDLLDRQPDADELALREAISGNLCRCTGYGRIFAAFRAVKEERARAST